MSTRIVLGNSVGRIRRVVLAWWVALAVGWAATVAAPVDDLIATATNGDEATVEALLAKRADGNAKDNHGGTALVAATAGGHADVRALLVQASAKP